jgi:hypothetical protein
MNAQSRAGKRCRNGMHLAIVGAASTILSPQSGWSDSGVPAFRRLATLGQIFEDDLRSLPYQCECEFFAGPIRGENTVFATRNNRTVAFARVERTTDHYAS